MNNLKILMWEKVKKGINSVGPIHSILRENRIDLQKFRLISFEKNYFGRDHNKRKISKSKIN